MAGRRIFRPEPESSQSPYDYGALVIRLRATEDTVAGLASKQGRLSAFMGSAVHQAFHRSISDFAAEVLHDPAVSQQPFATSTVFRWQLDIPLQGKIRPRDMAWIRFVGLHPYILRQLDTFRRSNPRFMEIDRVLWQVVGCSWDGHLYAGRFSAAERWHVHHQPGPPPRSIRLRFLTPTYLKSKNIDPYLEPDPNLIFAEGLLRRWQAFYPHLPPPPDFAQYVNKHVHLHRCTGWMTTTVMAKNALLRGFTGDVIYRIDAGPEEYASFLTLMAEYATFAGVGKKTTMGLGMVDRLRIIRRAS